MAIRIPNKNPLDLSKRIAIGVAIPFNMGTLSAQRANISRIIHKGLIYL